MNARSVRESHRPQIGTLPHPYAVVELLVHVHLLWVGPNEQHPGLGQLGPDNILLRHCTYTHPNLNPYSDIAGSCTLQWPRIRTGCLNYQCSLNSDTVEMVRNAQGKRYLPTKFV